MFSSIKSRLIAVLYIFLILSIPVGAYLVSQNQTTKSRASEETAKQPIVKFTPRPTVSPTKELLDASKSNLESLGAELEASPSPESSSPTIATSFGPTLSLSAILERRPSNNQATKLFVGIVEGTLTSNPKFLLSFSVDLPADGKYSNLSLAGLSSGSTYTALLKGASQISSSQSFVMSPTVTNLNNGNPITMISGDLNDDNVINAADSSIAQKAFGATSSSSNWNELADFNKDGIINSFDLSVVNKNLDQTGASGVWTSPIPQGSTEDGYWIYIPK